MPVEARECCGRYSVRFSVGRKPRRAAFVVGDFTANMKALELRFCGGDYCAHVALPPGIYRYRYIFDGGVVLDGGEAEGGYDLLRLAGSRPPRGPKPPRAVYAVFVDRFECK
ncbi:MAG: alpha-amylase, partial [Thermoproteus sp.]|nr:alpha-amylase [Thermoproteus sp.]